MNKAELIADVATKLEMSKAEAGRVIDTVIGAITAGAITTGDCIIPGLGKLSVEETSARSGVTKLGGVEKAWTKPAGKKLKLSLSKEGKGLV